MCVGLTAEFHPIQLPSAHRRATILAENFSHHAASGALILATESQTGMLIFPDYLIAEPGQSPRKNWGVRLVDDCIVAAGSFQELLDQFPKDDIWQATGQVLSPGFVDAHTHLAYLLAHGSPRPAHLTDDTFLSDFWWPGITDRLKGEMIAAAVDSACVNVLRSGVTTVADSLEAPSALPGVLSLIEQIVTRRGLRAVLSYIASQRVSQENGRMALAEIRRFLASHAPAHPAPLLNGRVTVDGGGTSSLAFVEEARELAQEQGVPFHIHSYRRQQRFDIDGQGVGVYTPVTERWPEGEKPPHVFIADEDAAVGLGSDGAVLDFFHVMRSASRQSRIAGKPLTAAQIWQLATLGGAQALGLAKVGKLAPGWQADLQLIDITLPTPVTAHNLYTQLLQHGSKNHVQSVLVAGEMRVCAGVVLNIDPALIRSRMHQAAQELWGTG